MLAAPVIRPQEISWLDEVISYTRARRVELMAVPNHFVSSRTSKEEVPVVTGVILDRPPEILIHIYLNTWRLRFVERSLGGNLKMAKRKSTYRSVQYLCGLIEL